MIEVDVPGIGRLEFPDGTPQETIRQAIERMRAQRGLGAPAAPGSDQSLASGNPTKTGGRVSLTPQENRDRISLIQREGDVGHQEIRDPGHGKMIASALAESVAAPVVGLAERARDFSRAHPTAAHALSAGVPVLATATQLVPEGSRQAIRRKFEETREDYLAQDPGSGLRAGIALGTEFAGNAVPLVPGAPIGKAATTAASRLAPRLFVEGGRVARMLAGAAPGAVEGALVGLGNSQGLSAGDSAVDTLLSAAGGAAFGMLGGLRSRPAVELAAQREVGGVRASTPDQATGKTLLAKERERLRTAYESERAELMQQVRSIDYSTLPPVQAREAFVANERTAMEAVNRKFHPLLADLSRRNGDPDLHRLADETEPIKGDAPEPLTDAEVLAAAESGLPPVYPGYGGQADAVRFAAWLQKRKVDPDLAERNGDMRSLQDEFFEEMNPEPSLADHGVESRTLAPDEDTGDLRPWIAGNETKRLGGVARLRQMKEGLVEFGHNFYDQFVDKENPPVRVARKAGERRAYEMKRVIGRARAAAVMARGPLVRGTRLFDANLGIDVRTGDSLASEVAGRSGEFLDDLSELMLAESHLEDVAANVRKLSEYDAQVAAHQEELQRLHLQGVEQRRQVRGLESEARKLRAQELRAARREARAGGQLDVRSSMARGAAGDTNAARDLVRRAEGVAARRASEGLDAGSRVEQSRAWRDAVVSRTRALERGESRWRERAAHDGVVDSLAEALGARSPTAPDQIRTSSEGYRAMLSEQARVERKVASAARIEAQEAHAAGQVHKAESALRRAERAEERARVLEEKARARQDAAGAEAADLAVASRGALKDAIMAGRQVSAGDARRAREARGLSLGTDSVWRRTRPEAPARPSLIENAMPDREATLRAEKSLERLRGKHGARFRELQRAAEGLRDWHVRAVLDPLREAGRISDEEFAAIFLARERYAPMLKLIEKLDSDPEITVESNRKDPLHARKTGLEKGTLPPVEAMILKAQEVHRWVERQRVRNTLADLADRYPQIAEMGVKLEGKAQAGRTPRGDRFVVWRNGEALEYTAPADVMGALERLTPKQASIAMKFLSLPAKTLRVGVTAAVDFIQRNPVRDQFSAAVNVEGYIPFWDLAKGFMYMADRKGRFPAYYQRFLDSGAAMSSFVALDRTQANMDIRDLRAHTGSAADATGAFFRNWRRSFDGWDPAGILYPLQRVSEVLEVGTRVGAYARLQKLGYNDIDAQSMVREATLDFGRSGSFGQMWNAVEAFANAEIQDADKFIRNLRRRPRPTMLKASAYIMIPALLNYAKNRDNERYKNLPEWEKVSFLHVYEKEDGSFVRIPRPLGLLNLAFSYGIHKSLELMEGEDPTSLADLLGAVVEQTPAHYFVNQGRPNITDLAPTALQPGLEVAAGEGGFSSFTNSDIVPKGLQDVLPEEQYFDSTSPLLKAAGAATGTSPIKLQYLVRNYGGTIGMNAVDLADAGMEAAGVEGEQLPPLPKQPYETVGARAFLSRPPIGFGSQPVTDLYNVAKQARDAKNTVDRMLEQRRVRAAQKAQAEHPEMALVDFLESTRADLTEMRQQRALIRAAKNLTPEQRMDALASIDQAVTAKAAMAMHAFSDYMRGKR